MVLGSLNPINVESHTFHCGFYYNTSLGQSTYDIKAFEHAQQGAATHLAEVHNPMGVGGQVQVVFQDL